MSRDASQQAWSSTTESPPLSRIGLNAHKAGMEGLDKDKINKIIVEASKGSKYYQNELRKDQELNKKVTLMLDSLKKVTASQMEAAARATNKKMQELEKSRDLSRIIVHVDMDAFYAAVEMRDDPKLRECPMAVGSNSMLSTSNYPARKYGVRAAMPGFIAKKLCPKLVIVSPNFDKYRKASEDVHKVLSEFDPDFCSMGLDESYLDITEFVQSKMVVDTEPSPVEDSHYALAETVVHDMRRRIYEATGLTASAGIAPNKMLAKIASDMNKPNGQFVVTPSRERILGFLKELPVRKISGIGRVTEKLLNSVDVTHCCHLLEKKEILHLLFSQSSSEFFLSTGLGLGSVEVQRLGDRKSISTERSFSPTSDPAEQMARCQELCQCLAEDMEKEGIQGRTITVKMKTSEFEVKSRALSGSRLVSKSKDIFEIASSLLQQEMEACNPIPLKLRLIGVRVSVLQSRNEKQTYWQKEKQSFSLEGPEMTADVESDASNSPVLLRQGKAQTSIQSFTTPTVTSQDSELLLDCATKTSNTSTITCPICGAHVPINNLFLNQHIDECLNQPEIESVTKKSSTSPQSSLTQTKSLKKSQKTLSSYFIAKDRCTKKMKHELSSDNQL